MKTYTVKPEGINAIRKRVLLFGAVFTLVVLSGVVLLLPDMTPLGFAVLALFVLLLGGLGFRRGLRRLVETWPTYTLFVADDYILKQQAHYPDIRIGRDEVKTIQKARGGDIAVKTGDWKRFMVIPRSLSGIEEVEELLARWKQVKQVPRAKNFLHHSLSLLALAIFIAVGRSYLRSSAPDLTIIISASFVILVMTVFLMRTMRRFPNLDNRSRPKQWKIIFMIGYIVLLVISIVVFFWLGR